jgi:hypothetical protein
VRRTEKKGLRGLQRLLKQDELVVTDLPLPGSKGRPLPDYLEAQEVTHFVMRVTKAHGRVDHLPVRPFASIVELAGCPTALQCGHASGAMLSL